MKNPEKYAANNRPLFRSSWERTVMQIMDDNPAVISWASESLRIPYVHPATGQISSYVPDFLVHYQDSQGKQWVELIEVKPASQSTLQEARSRKDQEAAIVNAAKWEAAAAWCANQGIRFRVLNEQDIYITRPKKKARPRIAKPRIKRR